MAGLYLHIPYCRKACTYCDFHFSTQLHSQAEMVAALVREMTNRKNFLPEQPLASVYFGGGTPSVLSADDISALLAAAASLWGMEPTAEMTLEANPDDLTPAYLAAIREAGINRLSIGVQSFREEDLLAMNRSHSSAQAISSLRAAREAGFEQLSLDLIFGLPQLDLAAWAANLDQALDLRPSHLSVYSLTVEAKTALAHQVKTRKVYLPSDEVFEGQFLLAHERLTAAGYEHYELSNYALPGARARHNSAYWAGEPYLGTGPSAHSFDGQRRTWNTANNHRYLQAIGTQGHAVEGEEWLSPLEKYHEYLMLGLRTDRGIRVGDIETRWVPGWRQIFRKELSFWLGQGHLLEENDVLRLAPGGWFLSDRISGDFFLDELPG